MLEIFWLDLKTWTPSEYLRQVHGGMCHSDNMSTVYLLYRLEYRFDISLLRLADFVKTVNEEKSTFVFRDEVTEQLLQFIDSGPWITCLVLEERFWAPLWLGKKVVDCNNLMQGAPQEGRYLQWILIGVVEEVIDYDRATVSCEFSTKMVDCMSPSGLLSTYSFVKSVVTSGLRTLRPIFHNQLCI